MTGHTPWPEVKAKLRRPHEFSGVLYGSERDAHVLTQLIADIVCPTGGHVITRPLREEDQEVEGNPHDDD